MSDYSKSRVNSRSTYPSNAIDAQDADRLEPVITAEQLRKRFLVGIKLITDVIDPITRKPQAITDEMLKDFIVRAINEAELETGIDIFPVQRDENHPFDRQTFQMWGYMHLEHAPILTVDKISIKPGNDQSLYDVPLEWVSSSQFNKGILNFVPILPASSNNFSLSPAGSGGGAVFLQLLNNLGWMPSFWSIQYTTGFYDGAVPRIVNELVGIYAAKEVLSTLAATNTLNSRSLSLDGIGQSTSGPGPQRYMQRIKELDEKAKKFSGKIRALFGKKFSSTNI